MAVTVAVPNFDPFLIMDSGQCFRMVPLSENTAETVAYGKRVTVTVLGNGRFSFDCAPEDFDLLWRRYFALDADYGAVLDAAPKDDALLANALRYADGLRILRQEPWETLCGFILSQRKNIKAIRACVEALCARYGEPVEGTARRAFPTAERLAALKEEELCLCSLGYRTPYLLAAARAAATGALDFAALALLPDEALFEALLTVRGVGPKVANCVMLFGFGRLARVPVDVWIDRVIRDGYGGASPFAGYGPYAGVYQQALFVYKRDGAPAAGRAAAMGRRAPPTGRTAG